MFAHQHLFDAFNAILKSLQRADQAAQSLTGQGWDIQRIVILQHCDQLPHPVLAGWNYNPKFREVSTQRAYEHGPLPYQQVPCAMMQ
jgi:hypothetical protein